ncbi:MAG TPA: DoxX family protein [Polyangiales bacterium]|nr:DoxX family protein [Polyangiales bacterium]
MTTITADSTVLNSNLNVATSVRASRAAIWTGRVLSGLGVSFMLFDGSAKLFDLVPPEVKAANSFGWNDDAMFTVGVLALLCTALYLIPRTALLGAILLTGYFGGAIATHLRVGNPLFSHTLFPIYIAALFWVGLYLRDARARALLAPRTSV